MVDQAKAVNEMPVVVEADKNLLKATGVKATEQQGTGERDQNGELLEIEQLPWLKDPNTRAGFFEIIKSNMGKEYSRISLPVYYNEPSSTTQKPA